MENELGDRIKRNYEDSYRIYLTRRTPVIIRVDGKAFHTLTSKMKKHLEAPFFPHFMNSMLYAAEKTAEEMQGFKLGYVQSDEASFLLTDYDKLETEAWFNYNLNKIVSVSASTMTAYFNDFWELGMTGLEGKVSVFDARAFNIPKEEIANYFLWRCQDWERNSLSMYCQAFFSHKELMNKGREEQHEMLHSIGKNWATDLSPREKNGTFIFRDGKTVNDFKADYGIINS